MSKNLNGSPLPPLQRPRYGVDAPAVPAVNGAAGVACYLAATRWRQLRVWYGGPWLGITLLHAVKE
jgi:hypothetical protein